MKRLIALMLTAILLILPLSACAQKANDGKISIVCTLFPQYDWIKSILGDSEHISLTLLIQNGTDPHSYQPTAADVMAISNSDMIVYVGADSDKWVQEALERSKNKNIEKVALSSLEGMTLHSISPSSHSHEGEEHDRDRNHGSFDEHLWLSVANAQAAVKALAEKICVLDSGNAEQYRKNADAYLQRLSALDKKFRQTVEASSKADRFMLFADRFPFVYLLEEYGIHYAAAFEGCSTDTDADFATVLRLIKEADEHSVGYIAITETADRALANTVSSSAKGRPQIIAMNSLQSVNKKQLSEGITYLSAMEENLTALATALSVEKQPLVKYTDPIS